MIPDHYLASFYVFNFPVAAMYFYFERARLFSGNVSDVNSFNNQQTHTEEMTMSGTQLWSEVSDLLTKRTLVFLNLLH